MKKYIFISFILSIFIIYLFYNSKETINITIDGISLFLNTLLPTLFPYLFIILLFINFKCHLIIAYFIQHISIPLFNISGKSFSIILIGIIGGYPLLALLGKEIINEYNQKEINKIIPLFSYPSLSFLLLIIKNNFNYNFFLIFIIASFILLFILKDNKKKEYLTKEELLYELNKPLNYLSTFKTTIYKTLNNLGLIFSNLLFFSLFKTLFSFKNEKLNYLSLGFFEFSKSSFYLSNNITSSLDVIILSIILLNGGISVLMQIFLVYSDSMLKINKYFIYRIIYILLVVVLILINTSFFSPYL